MSSASLVTVLGPSSFTSITVLHFIKLPDYLITLLMMPFKKNCRVFSNPDTWKLESVMKILALYFRTKNYQFAKNRQIE